MINKFPKLILVLVIFTVFLQAEQLSGLIIDESSGVPVKNYEFTINGKKLVTDQKGFYQAELPGAKPNHFYLKTKNNGDYLFVTNRSKLNIQLAFEKKERIPRTKAYAELKLNILENESAIADAEVIIYTVLENVKTIKSYRELHRYNNSIAEFKNIKPTNIMFAVVSRNNNLYVQRLERIVPGKINEVIIELSEFTKTEKLYGAAYKNSEEYFEILALPTANNYYVADNILPVFIKEFDKYKLIRFGLPEDYPSNLDYYNLREFVFGDEGRRLTVYSDIKIQTMDVSKYGKYAMKILRGYHIENLDFGNISPSLLKEVSNVFLLISEQKDNNEGDENE